jgi:hypothetical protein
MARNKLSETKIKATVKAGIYGDGDGLYIRVVDCRVNEARELLRCVELLEAIRRGEILVTPAEPADAG